MVSKDIGKSHERFLWSEDHYRKSIHFTAKYDGKNRGALWERSVQIPENLLIELIVRKNRKKYKITVDRWDTRWYYNKAVSNRQQKTKSDTEKPESLTLLELEKSWKNSKKSVDKWFAEWYHIKVAVRTAARYIKNFLKKLLTNTWRCDRI